MAESTLSLTYEALAAAVGDFLGYGRGAFYGDPLWTAFQALRVDDCVRSGSRKFYHPTPPYDWSFLHVFTDPPLELAPGAKFVPLPDNAAGIEDTIVVAGVGQSSWYPQLRVGSAPFVKAKYAQCPTTTGFPEWAAIEQLEGTTVVSGQRQRLIVFPAADQDYLLTFMYYIEPDAIAPAPVGGQAWGSASTNFPGIACGNPYVYGGPAHAETILEACLATAEVRRDDMEGLHTQMFQERLVASMAADRRSKPQLIARNRDRSDDNIYTHSRWWPQLPPTVLLNGNPIQ